MTRPGILMVTGAYWPEVSGGGLQCKTMIAAMGERARCSVLTTCTSRSVPARDEVDGVSVTRLFVDVRSPLTKLTAALGTVKYFLARHREFSIVHLHGFSQKSVLVVLLAKLFGKSIVITIHTAGHDEPEGARRIGALAYWCYARADRFIAISTLIADNFRKSGLPADRLRVAPNAIDVARFHPAGADERASARDRIGGLPVAPPWLLSVGFISADKCPDVLFDAWVRLRERTGIDTCLLFVGATESLYFEVDGSLAQRIREDAARRGVGHLLKFAGELPNVEDAYRAADIYAAPSAREAFGMALVEAMASGLPVVASRIAGVTDEIVRDGETGHLVPPKDAPALADAIERLLADRGRATQMGRRAAADVEKRFGLEAATERWMSIYRELHETMRMDRA